MKEAVIVSGVRTAIGRFGGILKDVSAPVLGAAAIKRAVENSGVNFKDVDVLKDKEPELDYDIEGELSDTLSEEERKKLAAILSNDNEDIIDTRKGSLEKENEEKEVASVFSEIEKLAIDGVYIFGNNKSADLTLSFYVGDGVEGESFENKFREIKENQIISVKGFKYQVKNITFKEVEIENMQNGELYIASKSLRTIK